MKEIKCTILYCVCENFCDSILLGVPIQLRSVAGNVPLWQKVMVPSSYGSGSAKLFRIRIQESQINAHPGTVTLFQALTFLPLVRLFLYVSGWLRLFLQLLLFILFLFLLLILRVGVRGGGGQDLASQAAQEPQQAAPQQVAQPPAKP